MTEIGQWLKTSLYKPFQSMVLPVSKGAVYPQDTKLEHEFLILIRTFLSFYIGTLSLCSYNTVKLWLAKFEVLI